MKEFSMFIDANKANTQTEVVNRLKLDAALHEVINDEKEAYYLYKEAIAIAKSYNNKALVKELSYTLLGLID